MRNPGTIRAILAAVSLIGFGLLTLLAMPMAALASHGPTVEQVVAVATSETWNMGCEGTGDSVECSAADFDGAWFEHASIGPASGSLDRVDARVTVRAAPLDSHFQGWHAALHGVACAPDRISAGQLSSFIGDVAGRREAGEAAPITIPGECSLSGGLTVVFSDSGTQYTYWIRSVVLAQPTPSDTPTPSPTQRPVGTPSPSEAATAAPTVTPNTASSSASSSAAASASQPPSTGATPSAVATAGDGSTSPTPTPEQQVLGGNPTPTPEGAPAAPVASPPPVTGIVAGALVRSVPAFDAVSTDAGAIAGSALLALLLLVFVGFAGELFNSTLESNYDEVAGWFGFAGVAGSGSALGLGRLAGIWRGPIGVLLFLGAGALVYALLDPGLGLDAATLATYLGLLLGLATILVSFELPGLLLYRRRTGELPGIRALPWTLPAAVACVVLSRAAELQPAYLYGILLGLVFGRQLSVADEGRQAAAGALWTLLVAVGAWAGLVAMRSGSVTLAGFGPVVAETALSVIVVGGLEAVALGLLPMRFLAGAAVYAWSRWAWAVLLLAGAFAFIHLLVGPQVGYLAELDPAAFVLACGAFAAFGAASLAFWAYFRFRPARSAT